MKTRIRSERIIPIEALFTLHIYLNWCIVHRVARKIGRTLLTFLLLMGQDSHSHSWNIVLLFVSTSRGNFFWFQNPLQTWQIPYEAMESFSSAKKSWGTLFFLPMVEGISWINQGLKTTVVKCHAEDSCKELNFNVTNNRLQQLYWNSRHHLICPASPVPTTTGLKGMFLPVWSPAGERSEKTWGDTVWIESGCFGGLLWW